MSADRNEDRERKARSTAEVTVLAVCSAIVAFLLTFSVYHAVTTTGTTPTISAVPMLENVSRRGDLYVLPVEVRNESKPTAQDVLVTVKATNNNNEVEDKDVLIDYLPEHSKQEVYITLRDRPTRNNIVVEIESFKLP